MLVWIASALSPQEIRDKISAPDAAFQKSLVDYLESTHVGHFQTGTMEQVKAKRIPCWLFRPNSQILPVTPPAPCECKRSNCPKCSALYSWQRHYVDTVDDLMLRSNVHSCRSPVPGTDFDGTCSARFPREVVLRTEVDVNDGSIKLQKLEPMVNNITPAVTYVLGCNTDVTCLLSGTSIKAVVAYISDYVTKSSLKTYHIFQSVQNVF
ncbi:hypothetical protein C8J57DRAFT_1024143, partial [Mycena rebaudengoi]